MKSVQNYFESINAKIGLLSGMVGGMFNYVLQIQSGTFVGSLTKATVTALICGAAGVAGKELYVFIKKRLKKK